jgi:hypothetical protein
MVEVQLLTIRAQNYSTFIALRIAAKVRYTVNNISIAAETFNERPKGRMNCFEVGHFYSLGGRS